MNYQYRGAGLDNVYLVNGYKEILCGGEKVVSIEDVAGLHKAIANKLIHKSSGLTGQEFRFLRIEMDLTQNRLARSLGVDEQTVANWEKNVTKQVPGAAERLMRLYASERILNEDGEISMLLEQLADLDHKVIEMMCFIDSVEGWTEAQAA